MSKPQHYPITIEKAIAHYQTGDITAKGLLLFYLNIRLAPGWTLKETQKQICETLGISRTAFYNALSRLKAEGSINWSTPENTKYSITLNQSSIEDNQSSIANNQSSIEDNQSSIADGQSSIADGQSLIVTVEKTETLPDKESGNPSYSYSSSFQIFINSLSEDERANFLNFCKRSVEHYKKPVVNLDDYLLSTDAIGIERWILLRNQWHVNKIQTGVLNPESKGVNIPADNTTKLDPTNQLIERLKKDWGQDYKQLIGAIYDGWIYFPKADDPFPLEQALELDSNKLKAIAKGEF